MMGFQSSCIMLGSSAEMCCAETLQIGFESFWVQLLKWVAYLELPKVGQNRKYVGNTLFIIGIFTIYSLQCMCASQILSLESRTMLAAHFISCVGCCQSTPCWAVLWPGGVWRCETSLSLHRATASGGKYREILLPLAFVALLVLAGHWAAAKVQQEGTGLASPCSQEAKPLSTPCGFVKAQIQCPAWGLRNCFHILHWSLQFPFVILLGSSNGVVVALIPSWVFCLFPTKL